MTLHTVTKYTAKLTGLQVVPPVATAASGLAAFTHDLLSGSVQYKIDVNKIKLVTAVELHLGTVGTNGALVATLFGPVKTGVTPKVGVLAAGTITDSSLVGPLAGKTVAALIAEFDKNNVYVLVKSVARPAGEIRGQVTRVASSLCPLASICSSGCTPSICSSV